MTGAEQAVAEMTAEVTALIKESYTNGSINTLDGLIKAFEEGKNEGDKVILKSTVVVFLKATKKIVEESAV